MSLALSSMWFGGTELTPPVDVKIQLTGVPRQMVQTKDNVSVDVDSVICWHVISPYRAAFGINDVRTALVERARKLFSLGLFRPTPQDI